ncbi:MAG: universal stress protein [Bacteroidetes bacterium]|nr:universal stress protein [Bacteroidota bacterium]
METKMNNTLLVPTDFTEVGNNAINMAAKAAKLLNYKLSLLHITESKEDESASGKLAAIAKKINADFGIEVDTLAKEGSIFTTIGETAKDLGASLIFMGTHGKVGMQKFTGSFALKVITSSECPVIIVQKRTFESTFKNIVLPITSDYGPWEKTKWAEYISNTFNAKIYILQLDTENITKTTDSVTKHFSENGVEFEVQKATKSGNFEKQVVDYATAINSDLIMIMTNPSKGLTSFILGSYDEEIIFNTTQIPVMCINPREVNWKKIVSR